MAGKPPVETFARRVFTSAVFLLALTLTLQCQLAIWEARTMNPTSRLHKTQGESLLWMRQRQH